MYKYLKALTCPDLDEHLTIWPENFKEYLMAFFCPNALLGILSIISILCQTNAQISTPCTGAMISTFTPCMNYVTGSSARGSSPTEDCCNAMKSLVTDSLDCVCLIVTGNVPVSIPYISRNLAISLPRMCKTSVPIRCKAPGDELPAPGPALFGPALAPAASASNSPVQEASTEAVPPADRSLDTAPASDPPEVWLGPSENSGMRPVVDSKSSSTPSTVTLPYLVLMFVGIIAFEFL